MVKALVKSIKEHNSIFFVFCFAINYSWYSILYNFQVYIIVVRHLVPHLHKLIRKPSCSIFWHQQEVQNMQALASQEPSLQCNMWILGKLLVHNINLNWKFLMISVQGQDYGIGALLNMAWALQLSLGLCVSDSSMCKNK